MCVLERERRYESEEEVANREEQLAPMTEGREKREKNTFYRQSWTGLHGVGVELLRTHMNSVFFFFFRVMHVE